MHYPLTLAIVACLLTSACTDSSSVGVRPDPLSAEVETPCLHPSEIARGTDLETFAGRLGDELIECRGEKAIAVDAFNDVRDIIGPQ